MTQAQTRIDFMGKRKIALFLSGLFVLISLISLATQGLRLGVDFTGGTLLEVGFEEAVELSDLRTLLQEKGFGDATVQRFGTTKDVLIRLAPKEGDVSSAELSGQVLNAINQWEGAKGELRRVEFVGPQVGEDLAEDAILALVFAMVGILIYVGWRFEYRFSIGAVAALVHDVIITLGLFSTVHLEFDLTVLAALLALIGYSINDTIVVYDRIRENFRKLRKDTPIEVMNISLNQTLGRTLLTSSTVVLVLIALYFLGGEIIHNFALALLFGVFVGTYSSIYVASPLVLALGVSKADLMLPEKEGGNIDNRP